MSRRRRVLAVGLIACLSVTSACGSTLHGDVVRAAQRGDVAGALAAYERSRDQEGRDPELLRVVASALLVNVATGSDASAARSAVGALSGAGPRGIDGLRSVAARAHGGIRAQALAALARLGDGGARASLRALADDADGDVQAAAVGVLDEPDDAARVRAALTSRHAAVRAAAATMLARSAAGSPDLRLALADSARSDADAGVRAAAVRALGRGGPEAVFLLRERLSDVDAQVRFAAIDAIVSADRAAGLLALGPLLEAAPNAASVESARMLAQARPAEDGTLPHGSVDARAYLLRALAQGDPTLRAQTAVAISSLPYDGTLDDALVVALDDADPRVKLSVATVLIERPAHVSRAKTTLAALVAAGGIDGVEAAATLAEHGDRTVARALGTAMRSADEVVRRAAVRAIAISARAPDAVRTALADPSVRVRIAAAGAILGLP